MNVLPLVLLLLLVLSMLSMQQVENFKNRGTIKKEFQDFLLYKARKDLNLNNKILYSNEYYDKTHRINFNFLLQSPTQDSIEVKQLKLIIKNLMVELYGHTTFFQKLKEKRPEFIDELLEQLIEKAREEELTLNGEIENLAHVELTDKELQNVFYQMIKGSMDNRDHVEKYRAAGTRNEGETYLSLLSFLSAKANEGYRERPAMIPIYITPKEILLAIYADEQTVKGILAKRKEVWPRKSTFKGAKTTEFTNFMKAQEKKQGITDTVLDFTVTTTNPENYN